VAQKNPTFIRFVVGADGQHHRELTGVVTEVRFLRDDDRLAPEEVVRLDDAYAWFNEHVPVPPFATARWPRDVVTWFKDDASDAISRMWDLVVLLREHSVEVRLLRSINPGRVLYEDDYQVVVEEWNRL
jgi:hypothetical protein